MKIRVPYCSRNFAVWIYLRNFAPSKDKVLDMRQKQGFVLREVCGENVIVAEGIEVVDFSNLISLNGTAAMVWKKAKELGDFTAEQLTDALCETYDVDYDHAHKDVLNLLKKWQDAGLLED